jgi:uncharacterized membrane protein
VIHLRRYFVAGLLFWVPVAVTVLVVRFLVNLLDRTLLLVPLQYRPESLLGFSLPGLGVLLALVVVFLTGIVVANLLGRRLLQLWEAVLARIPVVRSIYSGAKQVMETVVSGNGKSFREVVMVEYPRKGLWTLAFVTGDAYPQARQIIGEDAISIYVPTTPNPTSGFFLMVSGNELIRLNISVEDGLKLILSTGVLQPKAVALKPGIVGETGSGTRHSGSNQKN